MKVEKEMQIRADKEHRGIIEKEIFAAVERVLENDNRCSVGRNRVYVLSGVMYCGDCGEKMIRKAVGKYRYYMCSNKCTRINENEIIAAVSIFIRIIAENEKENKKNEAEMRIRKEMKDPLFDNNEEIRRYVENIFSGANEEEEILRKKIVMNLRKIVVYGKKRCEMYLC